MQHVWYKGDECLAPYNDGELYKGRIKRIQRHGGKVLATIQYDGYDSDCEDVPVSKLQTVSAKSRGDGSKTIRKEKTKDVSREVNYTSSTETSKGMM